MEFEITHEPGGDIGEFVVEHDGRRLGTMNYTRENGVVEILHTEVDPSLRGSGAAGQLVAAAVDWARREQLQIAPRCAYARSVFKKTPDYQDVLAR
jgi:hypothetical protein